MIVLSDGRRFGSAILCARFQSMYRVESAVDQNLRSSDSDLNFGIFFISIRTPASRDSSCPVLRSPE